MISAKASKTLAIVQQILTLGGGILTGFGVSATSYVEIGIGIAVSVIGTVWAILAKSATENNVINVLTHVAQFVTGIFVTKGKLAQPTADQIVAAIISAATFVLNYTFGNTPPPTTPTV